MFILILFGIIKTSLFLIRKRERQTKAIIVEIISTLLFILLSILLCEIKIKLLSFTLIAFLYFICSIVPKLFIKSNKQLPKIIDTIGISEIFLFSSLTFTLFFIFFLSSLNFYSLPQIGVSDKTYYQFEFQISSFIIDKVLIVLAVFVGISSTLMTVIWNNKLWAKKNAKNKNEFIDDTNFSIKIIITNIFIIFVTFYYLILPLLEKMNLAKDLLK